MSIFHTTDAGQQLATAVGWVALILLAIVLVVIVIGCVVDAILRWFAPKASGAATPDSPAEQMQPDLPDYQCADLMCPVHRRTDEYDESDRWKGNRDPQSAVASLLHNAHDRSYQEYNLN